MKVSLKPTPLTISATVILSLILAVISFCAALTDSPSTRIVTAYSLYDIRLQGAKPNARISPDFSFSEPRLAQRFAKSRIVIERPGGSETVYIGGSSVTYSDFGRGEKITGIFLEPRLLFLLPSASFGLLPILGIALLMILSCAASYSRASKSFSLIPPFIIAAASYYLLSANRYPFWDRGFWLWAAAMLVSAGSVWRILFNGRSEERSIAKRQTVVLLLAVFVTAAAALVRFQGLDFGLPAFFHPDEGRKMKIARGMVESGDLNPHYFRHPTFLLYATAGMTWINSLIHGSIPDLPTVDYLGRSVSAALGSFSVLILFLIVRLLYDARSGLIAAALLAAAPLHVVSSRYIKEDAAMVFFTLVCFYFVVRTLKKGPLISGVLLSSFLAGVSASSKYSGILNSLFIAFIFSNVIALKLMRMNPKLFGWMRCFWFDSPHLTLPLGKLVAVGAAALCLFAAGFVVISPYSVLDHEKFLFDFIGEKTHMERGHTVAITAISFFWTYHLHFSLLKALHPIAALLSLIACGYLAKRGKPADFLILAAILLFYLPAEYVNAKPEPQPERYIVPCIPFLCAALGIWLSRAAEPLKRSIPFGGSVAAAALTILVLWGPASYSWQHSQSIKNDTRWQAREWVSKNVPKGSKVLIDWHFYSAPLLDRDYKVMEFKSKEGNKLLRSLSKDSLISSEYDYLILSSFFYGRFLNPLYRAHNLSHRFKELFSEMKPVKVFKESSFSYGFHNPDILVFRLKKRPPARPTRHLSPS
ncbi:MAG: glycosyltransferase family 39 protein [Deltaproteobacteria bacterium]|nr:glycosyltransferase family 39 protein [Deltaproteobacteria bacterium]